MLDLTHYIIRGIEVGLYFIMALSVPVGSMCIFWRYSGASKDVEE